jgi:hypothetical protein
MSTSEPRVGERITAVRVSEDSLSVDLLDGRSLTVHSPGIRVYFTPLKRNETTSESSAAVLSSTGRMSMSISHLKDYSRVHRHLACMSSHGAG